MFGVISGHLNIYELTNMISYVGKFNGRNGHKKGQRKKSEDLSQKRAKKKLIKMPKAFACCSRIAKREGF